MSVGVIIAQAAGMRVSLSKLYQLVIKSIFDAKNMTSAERDVMQHSIVNWAKWINYEKQKKLDKFGPSWQDESIEVGKKGNPIDEAEFWLGICASYIDKDNKSLLEGQKANIYIHNLDYKKVFKFPGAVSNKDRFLAQETLKRNKLEQPEMYEGSGL